MRSGAVLPPQLATITFATEGLDAEGARERIDFPLMSLEYVHPHLVEEVRLLCLVRPWGHVG